MTEIKMTPGPLLDAAKNSKTALWNDSSDLEELRQSISWGGVGATCNPTIAYTTISKHLDIWAPRIKKIAESMPTPPNPKSVGRLLKTCPLKLPSC